MASNNEQIYEKIHKKIDNDFKILISEINVMFNQLRQHTATNIDHNFNRIPIMRKIKTRSNYNIHVHIKILDRYFANKLKLLCQNKDHYEATLQFYFGRINQFPNLQFQIDKEYERSIVSLIKSHKIDFDQYIIFLVNFINKLQTSVRKDKSGNYSIENRIHFSYSKSTDRFTYHQLKNKLEIQFSLHMAKPRTPPWFESDYFIELNNIKLSTPVISENSMLSSIVKYHRPITYKITENIIIQRLIKSIFNQLCITFASPFIYLQMSSPQY